MNTKIKILCAIAVLLVLCSCLAGCGNRSIGLGSYTFEHIRFSDSTESHCANVEKWYDNDRGIEVKTSEYGPIFCSEGTYILFNSQSKCPYCN